MGEAETFGGGGRKLNLLPISGNGKLVAGFFENRKACRIDKNNFRLNCNRLFAAANP